MCLGIPGRLVEVINEDFRVGTVEVSGVRGSVSLALLPEGTAVGDWVLVHVGFAIARIDEDEAQRTLAWLEGMGQAYADELQSFEASAAAARTTEPPGHQRSA
jgi:hydrogenase expression/formation protein HypC